MIRILVLLMALSSGRSHVEPEGCQVYAASGSSQSDSNPQPVQIQCSLRFLNVIPGLDWMNISHPEQSSARSLSIECGDPSAFPSALSRSSFAKFTQLESLSVDSCRLAELVGGSFRGLTRLRHLRVQTRNSEWPGTSLKLDEDVLDDIRGLESLDLAFNDIRTLPAASLCALKELTSLNLTSNRLTELGWMVSSACLTQLKVLDLSYNQLAHLPARMLASLTLLEELHLQGNNLLNVEDGSLDGLSSLRMINLAGNRLSLLPPHFLKSTPQLAEFYAGANGLSVLAPGIFSNLSELLVLDLSDNQLASSALLPAALAGLHRLAVLSLHNNRLQRLDASVMADLGNLQILRLDGNMLDALPDGLLQAQRHLHTLILSRNRLMRIEKDSLIRQSALAILALDNNLIEFIDVEAFRSTIQLHDLNLSGNYLPAVPEALSPLTRLQSLDLGENRIVGFDASILMQMKELSSLRLLDNAVGNISRDTFAELPSLRILNLSKNLIRHVEEGSFSRNPLLQAVRLDANQLTAIEGLFSTLPHLAWLNVSDNQLMHFDYSLIPKSLQWLDIHLNQVAELGNYFQLDESLALQTLDASFNRLTELTAAMLPDSLQVVSLNDNLIRSVQPYAFFRKENLSRVDLYANHIQQLDQNALRISSADPAAARPLPEFYIGGNPFECDCHMEWIQRINTPDHLRQHPRVMDLESIYCRLPHSRPQRSYVPLVEADSRHFVCTYQSHCFALCHCCDFDACDCEMTCPGDCTCYHDQSWSANVVDCSANSHRQLPERIPMDVTELYLDGNQLHSLASHKFIGRKNLRQLFLNSSHIELIGNRTFNGLKGLRTLHLEDNRIRTLVGFEFGDLESLRELYLHNNVITTLGNATFRSLRNLEILRLDGNRLVDFPVWNLIPTSPYLIELTLAGNQWSCDCAFLTPFRNALQMAGSKVPDAADLLCVSNEIRASGTGNTIRIVRPEALLASSASSASNSNGKRSNNSNGLLMMTEEEDDCIRPTPSATTIVQQRVIHDYLPLLVTTLVAFVCITCLVLVAFVYRNAIRIWCHARYGLRLVRPSGATEALDSSKLFDAFVSYSAKDDAFVQQMLATNLEYGSPSYKLCLQHRDCPSGGSSYLSESIARAVESSRRTIMVISHNFIKAEWCRFEYKSALHQLLKNRRKCLVVILIGDIRRKDLDPDLKLYLKTSTYLQWGQVGFWDRLRYALPDVPRSKNVRHNAPIGHGHGHGHGHVRNVPPCTVTIPSRSVTLTMSS